MDICLSFNQTLSSRQRGCVHAPLSNIHRNQGHCGLKSLVDGGFFVYCFLLLKQTVGCICIKDIVCLCVCVCVYFGGGAFVGGAVWAHIQNERIFKFSYQAIQKTFHTSLVVLCSHLLRDWARYKNIHQVDKIHYPFLTYDLKHLSATI